MKATSLALFLFVFMFAATSNAATYQWRDKDGRIIFSNIQPTDRDIKYTVSPAAPEAEPQEAQEMQDNQSIKKIDNPEKSTFDPGFEVARFYQSAVGQHSVIMKTKVGGHVKCVVMDAFGNPLIVQEGNINPPIDELPINTENATQDVRNVECSFQVE